MNADDAAKREKALEFLKKKQASTRNFAFDKGDPYALIEAVDPKWQGALPHTIAGGAGRQGDLPERGRLRHAEAAQGDRGVARALLPLDAGREVRCARRSRAGGRPAPCRRSPSRRRRGGADPAPARASSRRRSSPRRRTASCSPSSTACAWPTSRTAWTRWACQNVGLMDPEIRPLWKDTQDVHAPLHRHRRHRALRADAAAAGGDAARSRSSTAGRGVVQHALARAVQVPAPAGDGAGDRRRRAADVGSIGSNNIMAWKLRGAVGVVTNATARDTDEIVTEKVPLYFRRPGPRHPAGPQRDRVGQPARSSCGGVLVMPGDVIVADGDGVLVVPRARAAEVAALRPQHPRRRQGRPPRSSTRSSACRRTSRSSSRRGQILKSAHRPEKRLDSRPDPRTPWPFRRRTVRSCSPLGAATRRNARGRSTGSSRPTGGRSSSTSAAVGARATKTLATSPRGSSPPPSRRNGSRGSIPPGGSSGRTCSPASTATWPRRGGPVGG